MPPNEPITHVSDTAFLVAGFRAEETARPGALFQDPLAERLLGERGRALVASLPRTRSMGAWSVVIRTVIIDDLLAVAVAGGVDTVLNLGAGLDTRPYRLDLPASLRWIEVDFADVVALKAERLEGEAARCRLDRVDLDLLDLPGRARLLAGIDAAAEHLLVLTEGVVPYLQTADAGRLADDLRGLAHLDAWIVDYISPVVARYRQRVTQLHGVPFRFRPDDWFAFFAAHGWKVAQMRYIAEEAERLHRPIPLSGRMKALARLRGLLASKKRREAFRRFSGYARLEPG